MADSVPQAASYAQSFSEAKSHGSAFLRSTIGAHPNATAVVIAVLVVLVLILAYYVVQYKSKCDKGKAGFHVTSTGNLDTGNNNPLWQFGSMDAGNWGPVHREATVWNEAVVHPGWRAGHYRLAAKIPATKEGMYGGAPAPPGNVCAPGETPVTYQNPDGSMMVYCRNTNALPGPATVCKKGWDPAASAEAEALATVGALEHDSYGEKKLQRAVDAAYDSNVGLSDEQLSAVMHEGGTP